MVSAPAGSLYVMLGMNAADFDAGAKRATATMDALAKRMGAAAAMAAAKWALLGAGVLAMSRNIAQGVGGAFNSIGDMADMSQKFGVAAESLMGLGHAAEQSGSSVEGLAKGLQKLSVSMVDAVSGKGGKGADVFKALNLSATEANGALKSTDQMLIDLADKFQGMEDGAAKTAAAVAIFGKSGAELIPMLNLGSAELQRMRQEADSLGLVLDSDTASAVEALGDKFSNLGKMVKGFWTQLIGELTPAMHHIVDSFNAWISTTGGVKAWGIAAGQAIKDMIAGAYQASAALARLAAGWQLLRDVAKAVVTDDTIVAANQRNADAIKAIDEKLNSDLAGIYAERYAVEAQFETARREGVVAKHIEANTKLTEGEQELNRLIEERKRLVEELQEPHERLAADIEKLDILQAHAGLSADMYGRAMERAAWTAANAHAGAASKIMGNLQGVFGKAKGFAIAQAVINTYEAFTAALKGPPGPPWSYAIAASTLAAGFAQVRAIQSTNPGSSGGGGGGAAAATANTGGGAGAGPQVMTIQGINASDLYSGGQMRDLAQQIIKYQQDGGEVLIK